MEYNKIFQNPFFLISASALLVYVVMFLNEKISREYVEKSTYYKNISLTSLLVGASLFASKFNFNKIMKGGEQQNERLLNKREEKNYELLDQGFDE